MSLDFTAGGAMVISEGGVTSLDTSTPMLHILTELSGQFTIPSLSYGFVTTFGGSFTTTYQTTVDLGAVDSLATVITGACYFSPLSGSETYPTVFDYGWVAAGGTFAYEYKALQSRTSGAWNPMVSSAGFVSFVLSGGRAYAVLDFALFDGFQTSLRGSTVDYRLFAGVFS